MSVRRHIVCDGCGQQSEPYGYPETARRVRARIELAGWECSPDRDTCAECVAARGPEPLHAQLAAAGVDLSEVASLAMCSERDVRDVLSGRADASPVMVGMFAAALGRPVADVRAALEVAA
jgi:hypothetical protein